ncbi:MULTISPECIES: hypothetical protein [Sphingobacterium]|uniref:DUF4625 domain-containing protein n=2 Tax=Sphingobacterium TaxID=28453 RepID=A0A4R6WIB0_9SPHI|nr:MULTISPECIES: hypothetical protein [Sphingobacterium]TDQ78137.1 hypothetical protein CLV99_2115 [Sphingobacterium yanglingense]
MKIQIKFIFPLLLMVLNSCSPQKQDIVWKWNKDNEKMHFFVGQQIPLRVDINSKDRPDSVWIQIKQVDGGNWSYLKPVPSHLLLSHSPYSVETNIEVPDTANTGKYKVGLFAKLPDGSIIQDIVDIDLSIDTSFPWISDLDIGLNARQDDLHLAADLSAAKKINKVHVYIEGAGWKGSYDFQGSSLKDRITAHFHEHVDIKEAPAGDYSLQLVLTDGLGRVTKQKGSFKKTK